MINLLFKIILLPVLLIVNILYLLANLFMNLSSYVIGLFLLLIVGCGIYCIVKALWTSFFLLIALGVAAFLVIFSMVWAVVKIEALGSFLRDWIWS